MGLPFTPPGDLPDPGIHPVSSVFPALAGGLVMLQECYTIRHFALDHSSTWIVLS